MTVFLVRRLRALPNVDAVKALRHALKSFAATFRTAMCLG
jgi:hypothetical protein